MLKYENNNNQQFRINDRIRFSPILLIDESGEKIGVISVDDAKSRAREAGLDLVEVAPNARPPVCRIMDFGKFKYELGIKEKKQRAKQKEQQVKEVRLSPRIAEHDIITKKNLAHKFLVAGFKVMLRLEYKRRENAHKDLGFDVIKKVLEGLADVGNPLHAPKLEGRFLTCLVEPIVVEEKVKE